MSSTTTEPRWLSAQEQASWRAYLRGSRLLEHALDRDLQVHGVQLSEYEIISMLSEAPGRRLRMSSLAEKVVQSRSRLTHTAARLEKRGWVRREACLEDRRGAYVYGGRKRKNALLNEEDRHEKPVFHTLLSTHPETGRRVLYFDPGKILYIEGLPADESEALIDELAGYMVQPQGHYRHRWRKGDVVIWDNRCSYHKAAGDYPPQEDRIHWRTSIKEHAHAAAATAG